MEIMKRKKKKGRPSKTPLLSTSAKPSHRRSTRRNPNFNNFDESDDERKEKKVKLVVRLPQNDDGTGQRNRDSPECDSSSRSGSESDQDSEELQEMNAKKCKINGGSINAVGDQEEKLLKETDTSNGSPMESVCATPLPEKKLLVFILQRIQKKDTRGAFAEPVDPDELPDYHEIIEQPMDFGTINKKLDIGAYKTLEEVEADVLLLCSNAMKYNPSDSIYYRQARSIQELATRDFENLRHEGDDGQPQPKVVRRGRPPGKNQKKAPEISPIDRVIPEVSSGETLANWDCKTTGSNSYNLRKPPPLYSFRSTDPFVSSYRRNGENFAELINWNNEFPASILRADMKYNKKQLPVDETRRDTYGQFHPLSYGQESHALSNFAGDVKQLVPVGLQDPFAYARSMARYAADLGPVAWKIASKKIESILPVGVEYGPGWVGDNVITPSNPLSLPSEQPKSSNCVVGDCNLRKLATPSTSDLNSAIASEQMVEAVRKLNNQNELPIQGDVSSWRMQLQAQQNPHHPHRNGFAGMFGYNLSSGVIQGYTQTEGTSFPSKMAEMVTRNDQSKNHFPAPNRVVIPEEAKFPPEYLIAKGKVPWQALAMQQRYNNLSIPPDLNVQDPTVSPNSSIQIGSPQQQPDLALQL